MSFRKLRFFGGRRLSAWPKNADHAADAGKPRESAEEHSSGRAAADRSGDGRRRAAGAAVERSFVTPLIAGASEAIHGPGRNSGLLRRLRFSQWRRHAALLPS